MLNDDDLGFLIVYFVNQVTKNFPDVDEFCIVKILGKALQNDKFVLTWPKNDDHNFSDALKVLIKSDIIEETQAFEAEHEFNLNCVYDPQRKQFCFSDPNVNVGFYKTKKRPTLLWESIEK